MNTGFSAARWLALVIPATLIGGALIGQFYFGLFPCEMCHWQRWPHYAAIGLALLTFVLPARAVQRALVTLAAIAIAISGGIGIFHAGVEYGWWDGLTACATPGAMTLDDILATPLVRCDVAPWTLFGISLAGFNALISLTGAGLILTLLRRARVLGR